MHRPRPASAEPATVTVAAAYEGAVMTTNYTLSRPLTCSEQGVRFGAYNGLVTTNALDSTTFTTAPAAGAVAR